MFLVGHMCWAYITARASSSALKVNNINPYVILLLGALPDIDLLFGSYGVGHRTLTHSLIFWTIIFIPVFVHYGKRGIPYFVAPIQHIILGDLLVEETNPIWPLLDVEFGLGFGIFSIQNIAVEGIGLALFLVLVSRRTNYRAFFGVAKRGLLSIAPLVPVVVFLAFAFQEGLRLPIFLEHAIPLQALEDIGGWIFHSERLPVVTAMHLILAIFLSVSVVQGSRAFLSRSIKDKKETEGGI